LSDDRPLVAASLTAVLRLGEGSSDAAFELSGVRSLAVGRGAVYVVPEGEGEVRVFDLAGRATRRIGRRGSGPGEFQSPIAVGVLGDSVWVIDGDTRRVSWFSSAGGYARSVQTIGVPSGHGDRRRSLVFAMPQQLFADRSMFALGGYLARDVANGSATSQTVLHLSADATRADTIGGLTIRNAALVLRSARFTQYRVQPYHDGPLALASRVDSRVFVVDRSVHAARVGVLKVAALGMRGDTVWKQQLVYTPVRVPTREIDSVQRAMERSAGREFGGQVRDALYRPAFRVPVSGLVSTGEGGLWLRRADRGAGRRPAYLELDRVGRPVRCIDVAPGSHVMWVAGNDAWGIELDADDVPRITRFVIKTVR
jgi:hypothetical protein